MIAQAYVEANHRRGIVAATVICLNVRLCDHAAHPRVLVNVRTSAATSHWIDPPSDQDLLYIAVRRSAARPRRTRRQTGNTRRDGRWEPGNGSCARLAVVIGRWIKRFRQGLRVTLNSPTPGARSSTDRASDYGSEGWGFESLRAHQIPRLTCRFAGGRLVLGAGESIDSTFTSH